MRCPHRQVPFALAWMAALSACAGPQGPDPSAAWVLTGRPPAPVAELEWLPDGAALWVGDRWLLYPREARWRALPYEAPRRRRALSADGRWVAVWAHDPALRGAPTLRVGPVEGPLGPEIPIPRWLKASPPEGELQHALLWLAPGRLYVHQWWDRAVEGPGEVACRVLELQEGEWSWLGECAAGDFVGIWRLQRGPRDWIAASSSSEGLQGVRLLRWAGHNAPLPPGTPLFDLSPLGWMEAQFIRGGAELLLSTPCDLDRGGCEGRIDAPWRIYGWPLEGGALTLLYPEVPPFALPSPDRARLAWPQGSQVCVSRDIEGHQPECFQPPPGAD
jgi:hypothetical protein